MRTKSKRVDPAKIEAYRSTFVKHVHLLVFRAHSRLDRASLQSLHEPAITGLICQQIEAILDDPASPRWVDDYEIHDDPPVHDKKRQGKHRRRVDLKLASRRFRPRCRFCFEAKCFNETSGVADYLGPEGLGQFITGSYAAGDLQAGMLAYVQTDESDTWCLKIAKKMNPKTHRLTNLGVWTQICVSKEIGNSFRTIHKRPKGLREVVVVHTCLDCC